MKRLFALVILAGSMLSGAAMADDAAVLRCRAIGDTAGRLSCYDAMPVGVVTAAAPAAPALTPAEVKQAQVTSFGMESNVQAQKQANQEKLQSFDSQVLGHFDGYQSGTAIKLTNGQIWRVSDGSDAYMDVDSPKVKVVRGSLGSYFMEFEGSNRSPRVIRIK